MSKFMDKVKSIFGFQVQEIKDEANTSLEPLGRAISEAAKAKPKAKRTPKAKKAKKPKKSPKTKPISESPIQLQEMKVEKKKPRKEKKPVEPVNESANIEVVPDIEDVLTVASEVVSNT